jgi:hypothetical protein
MSLGTLSRSDLETILLAHGYEDAAQFGNDELISLIKVLGVDIPERKEEQSLSTPPPPKLEESFPPATPNASDSTLTEIIPDFPSRPFDESFAAESFEGSRFVKEGEIEGTASENAIHTPDNPMSFVGSTAAVGLSNEQEASLAAFCEISGSDKDFARSILENLGWDLNSAIVIYLEGGIQVPQKPSEIPPPVSHSISSNDVSRRTDPDAERAPTVTHTANASENASHLRHRHSYFYREEEADEMDDDGEITSYGGFGDSSRRRKKENNEAQFYDDGVRVRTDPVRMQRLISRQQSDEQDHLMLGRADDPNVEWMVEPPRHLSFMGSLEHVSC